MPITLTRLLSSLTLALLSAGMQVARGDPLASIPPFGPGPYEVACNNITQDFTRVSQGEMAADYWEGSPNGLRPRYITNLLTDLSNTFYQSVAIPNDGELYGKYAEVVDLDGRRIDKVLAQTVPEPADAAAGD